MNGMIDLDGAIAPAAPAGSSLPWYALQTHPGCEYRVKRLLDRAAEVYVKGSLADLAPRARLARSALDPMVVRDFRSARHLARDGYELWLPECVVVSRLRRIVIRKKGPWFPAYLFIRLDLSAGWRELDDVAGVAGLLLDGGKPRMLAPERIEGLRALCGAQGGVAMIAVPPAREFRKGQEVRIAEGILAGHRAIYSESVRARHSAMLDLLCNGVRLEIPEAQLEAVS